MVKGEIFSRSEGTLEDHFKEYHSWRDKFISATEKIKSDVTYEESAAYLRELVQTKLLKLTDMRDNPSRFFEAHRLLLAPSTRGPGFGIRFTVQFNLFAGSILGLGSEEQVGLLETFSEEGRLGCFCLTETLAGVNSGLVVNTTCTWDVKEKCFVLNTPDEDSHKNWISQGLTASKAVVIADLVIKDQHYGPHGFLIDLRESESGKPLPGISMVDMGKKTTGNDLDNARIAFNNVKLSKETLLSRFCDIDPKTDKYIQKEQKMRLEIIGQRLLTGRLAIAQAALVFGMKLFEQTENFAKSRRIWSPKGAPKMHLSDLPQLKSLFQQANEQFSTLFSYTKAIEKEISQILLNSTIPDANLVEKIAAAKISCIETSIEMCFRLKQEVGSYGLMDKTGFQHLDFLQCCKFAEGDSRILGQKIARDTMKKFSKGQIPENEMSLFKSCNDLAKSLEGKVGGQRITAWNDEWRKVYAVSDAAIGMHIKNTIGRNFSKL